MSGGFAIVQPNSVLSINAVEGFPLEDFSSEAVNSQIQEAQKVAGGNGSEVDIAEAKIELEVRHFPSQFATLLTVSGTGIAAISYEIDNQSCCVYKFTCEPMPCACSHFLYYRS